MTEREQMIADYHAGLIDRKRLKAWLNRIDERGSTTKEPDPVRPDTLKRRGEPEPLTILETLIVCLTERWVLMAAVLLMVSWDVFF